MQTKSLAAAVLLISSCLCALATEAPRAEKPQINFKPGQYFEFSESQANFGGCKRWHIKDANVNGMMVIQCNDLLMYQSVTNNFNPTKLTKTDGEVLFEFKPYMPTLAFPLEVGKKWTGEYSGYTADNGDKWSGRPECEATAFEKVKVVAGEFDAFRIDCVDHWRALLVFSGEKTSTRWYAPKIGAVVKVVHEDSKWNYQLTGYKLD